MSPFCTIQGLAGRYHADCAQNIVRYQLREGSIVPLCHECLHEMFQNHDLERIQRRMREAHMLGEISENNKLDANGNATGGITTGLGFVIAWQDGPLGRGADRKSPNGAFVETIISAAIGRLDFYQTASGGRFACSQNEEALAALYTALQALNTRTRVREAREVEGTNQP